MVSDFLVFGSCNSRDIFYSRVNDNYKTFFKILGDSQRTSIISLMQKPIPFDEEQIQIFNEDNLDRFRTKNVREELNKNFLNILKNTTADYLLMDNHFEVDAGILELEDGSLITYNKDIQAAPLYSTLKKKRTITMQNNTSEYVDLYAKYFNLFFEYLNEFCPNINVILNITRWVPNVLKLNGDIEFLESFQERANAHNKYREILDNYVLKNFDVDILCFDNSTLALESHWGGFHPSHFDLSYLKDKNVQLNEIVYRDKLLDESIKLKDLNKNIRKLRRENWMCREENQKLSKYNTKI